MAATATLVGRVPVPALFGISAVFHYLGPAFAVLLFASLSTGGVVWLRIASAAVVFAVWRGPRKLARLACRPRMVALGLVLAAMNTVFYLAIARLPLATVGAIEFLGPVLLAAIAVRTPRNAFALVFAVGGVVVLTDLRIVDSPWGFVLAFANCAFFVAYVVLGHKVAGAEGIDALGAAMLVAAVAVTPYGIGPAVAAFTQPLVLLAGIAVGLCSSVIPYVADQLAMARVRRATFALMLSLLPAMATVIGLVVLAQRPSLAELAGIALVIAGVALHREQEN